MNICIQGREEAVIAMSDCTVQVQMVHRKYTILEAWYNLWLHCTSTDGTQMVHKYWKPYLVQYLTALYKYRWYTESTQYLKHGTIYDCTVQVQMVHRWYTNTGSHACTVQEQYTEGTQYWKPYLVQSMTALYKYRWYKYGTQILEAILGTLFDCTVQVQMVHRKYTNTGSHTWYKVN